MLQGKLRETLKAETDALHRELDRSFEAFDLLSPEGYARFLAAHKLAADQYHPVVNAFCQAELGRPLPDYPGMLAEDLDALDSRHSREDSSTDRDRKIEPDNAGLTYVTLGSRLGLAAIYAKDGETLARAHPACEHRFLGERDGLQLWRAFLAWDKANLLCNAEQQRANEQARQGFAMFAAAAAQFQLQP